MQILDNDPLDLGGYSGETVTVEVVSNKAQVNMRLDGRAFTSGAFTLNREQADPSYLAVGGVYADTQNGGGSFSVSLTGSTGPPATKVVRQFKPAEARRSFVFTIDVHKRAERD